MKKHVEDTIKSTGDYSHFGIKNKVVKTFIKSWKTKLTSTPVGLLFFNEISDNVSSVSTNSRNINDLKDSLVAKAKTKFNSYKTLKKNRDFDEKSIFVTTEGCKYKGILSCLFCEDTVGVNYQIYENSGSWLFSNLYRHIKLYHLSTNNANVSRNQKRLAQLSLKAANGNDKRKKLIETQTNQDEHSQLYSSTGDKIKEVMNKNDSDLAITTEPQPTVTDISEQQTDELGDAREDAIYLQFATQIIKMKNSCILNNEKVIQFYSEQDLSENSTSNEVKCCRIRGNGDCLFASVSHQLFQAKIDSAQHDEYTRKLRSDVVRHIQTNLPSFINCLKGRVYEDFENGVKEKVKRIEKSENGKKDYDEKIHALCKSFVDETLAGGCWGGTESVKALSEIYKVNILFIEDDGTCNMVDRFNEKFHQSILLAYRRNGNHYESIVAMDNSTITHFAKSFVEGEIKPIETTCNFIIDSD